MITLPPLNLKAVASIVGILAVIVVGWYVKSVFDERDRLQTELAQEKIVTEVYQEANQGFESAIERLKAQNEAINAKLLDLQAKQDKVNTELTDVKNKQADYATREDTVVAKPGLVQRLEQRALDKFMNEVAELGDTK